MCETRCSASANLAPTPWSSVLSTWRTSSTVPTSLASTNCGWTTLLIVKVACAPRASPSTRCSLPLSIYIHARALFLYFHTYACVRARTHARTHTHTHTHTRGRRPLPGALSLCLFIYTRARTHTHTQEGVALYPMLSPSL